MDKITMMMIAKICHQANKAYCEIIGDSSQPDWEDAPDWQRESALDGVRFHLGSNTTPEMSHENWMKLKEADGWAWGPEKDPEKKAHPCMVPFCELPVEQQMKDKLFHSIVQAFKEISRV